MSVCTPPAIGSYLGLPRLSCPVCQLPQEIALQVGAGGVGGYPTQRFPYYTVMYQAVERSLDIYLRAV